MRRLEAYILIAVLAACANAQERTGQTEKKEPEARKVELPQSGEVQSPPLPKIELPEFVITGIVSLSVPNVHKLGVAETPRAADVRGYHVMGSRERVTVELENRQKESLLSSSSMLSGQVGASLGSYFTPRAELWVGQTLPSYDYRVSAAYHRTKGYIDNTDRSGGNLGINGGIAFDSGAFEGYRLGGDLSYCTDGYRFYGSPSPLTRRELTNYRFGLSLSQVQSTEFSFTPALDYSYFQVDDSATKTQQQKATIGLNAELPLSSVILVGNVSYTNATISGAHSGHLTLFQLRVGTSRYWWNDLFLQGAAQVFVTKGMSGQRFSRIYPDVSIGYRLVGAHVASVSYAGGIGFNDIEGSVRTIPYLSVGSAFWHSDIKRRLAVVIESDWSGGVKTQLSAGNEVIDLYAMPADPLNTGIWQFAYAGATFWKYQAEGFAKLTPNDYVSGKVVVNATKNDVSDLAVPYVPKFEAGGSFTHWFPFGVSVTPSVSYQGVRESNLTVSQELPGFLLVGFGVEYEPLPSLRFFIDGHNITNEKYELWKGYQAPPLMVTGGLSYRW